VDDSSSYDPASSTVAGRVVWAGWRSSRTITEVRAQERVDTACHVHLAEMQVCLGDVGCQAGVGQCVGSGLVIRINVERQSTDARRQDRASIGVDCSDLKEPVEPSFEFLREGGGSGQYHEANRGGHYWKSRHLILPSKAGDSIHLRRSTAYLFDSPDWAETSRRTRCGPYTTRGSKTSATATSYGLSCGGSHGLGREPSPRSLLIPKDPSRLACQWPTV